MVNFSALYISRASLQLTLSRSLQVLDVPAVLASLNSPWALQPQDSRTCCFSTALFLPWASMAGFPTSLQFQLKCFTSKLLFPTLYFVPSFYLSHSVNMFISLFTYCVSFTWNCKCPKEKKHACFICQCIPSPLAHRSYPVNTNFRCMDFVICLC